MPGIESDNRGASEAAALNEFNEAFALAAQEGAEGTPAKNDAVIEMPAEEKPIVPPAQVEPPVKTEVQAPVVPVDQQQPGESDEKFEQRYKTLQGIHKHDKENWELEKAELIAKIEEAKKVVTPEAKKETAIPAEIEEALSPEEQEELDQYERDFDVIAKMEGKKRQIELKKFRKEFQGFVDGIKDELKKEFTEQLTPAQEFIKESLEVQEVQSKAEHFAMLEEKHADYAKYRDDGSILNWIGAKPKYLQKSMIETYQKGEISDVIALLDDFKNDNNIPITQSPNVSSDTKKAEKAEKKLAMTSVTTKKGAVNPSMGAAQDYEGAFEEAIRKQGG